MHYFLFAILLRLPTTLDPMLVDVLIRAFKVLNLMYNNIHFIGFLFFSIFTRYWSLFLHFKFLHIGLFLIIVEAYSRGSVLRGIIGGFLFDFGSY